MVPDELVRRWETAYRRYGEASRASAVVGDQRGAEQMASASAEVAAAWRELGSCSELPWWMAAALSAAVEAFEFQARDWDTRTQQAWSASDVGSAQGQARLVPVPERPRPYPHARRPGGEG